MPILAEHTITIKNQTSGAAGGGSRGGGPKDPNNKAILDALKRVENALRSKKSTGSPIVAGGGSDPKALKPFFDKLTKAISSNPAMDTRKLETLIKQLIRQQKSGPSSQQKNININVPELTKAINIEIKKATGMKIDVTPEIDERKITRKVADAVKTGVKKAAPEVTRTLAQMGADKLELNIDVRQAEAKIRKVKKDLDNITGKNVPVNVDFTGTASTKEELGTKIKHIISDIDSIGEVNPEVVVSIKGDSGKSLAEELADIRKSVISSKGKTKGELLINLPNKAELEKTVSSLERIKDIVIDVDITDVIKAGKALFELDKKEIKTKKISVDFDYENTINNFIKELSDKISKIDLSDKILSGLRSVRDETIKSKKELKDLSKQHENLGGRPGSKLVADKITKKKSAVDEEIKAIKAHAAEIRKQTADIKKSPGSRIQMPAASQGRINQAKEMTDNLRSLRAPLEIPSLGKSQLITPSIKPEDIKKLTGGFQVPNYAKDVRAAVDNNINDLSRSLGSLQKYVVDSLEKSFKETGSGWEIVKSKGEKLTDYFSQSGGRTSKQAKQWRVQIADVKTIKTQVPDFKGGDVKALISDWRTSILNDITENLGKDMRKIRERVGKWVKVTPTVDIEEWEGLFKGTKISGDYRKRLVEIKKAHANITGVSETMLNEIVQMVNNDVNELENLFKDTMGKIEAERTMSEFKVGEDKVFRSVAIPAARVTPTGAGVFETGSGSQRGLSKFATFVSGFEDLYGRLASLKVPGKTQDFQTKVAEFTKEPPKGTRIPEASDLVSNMLKSLVSGTSGTAQKEQITFIKSQYKQAGVMRGVKREQVLGEGEAKRFSAEIDEMADSFSGADIDGFMKTMNTAGVSVLDFARSLDAVKFENVYDVYKKVLGGRTTPGGKEVKPLSALGEKPQWEGRIRDFEKAIRQVEQLMPIIDPSRPRRALHQESSLNILTRTSPAFAGEKRLPPPEQKSLIKNLNLRFDELISEAKALRKMDFGAGRLAQLGLPEQIRTISSLGIPESQAGAFAEYTEGGRVPKGADVSEDFKEGIEYLKALGAVSVKMYTENLRELAPFAMEFQQLGRNISNVTNAMSSDVKEISKMPGELITGRGTEFPGLRTGREKEVISAGRYGTQGYGFNVMAELRNTAGTFEDQVLISGKLADVLTSTVKRLVQPSAMGRIYGKGLMEGEDPSMMIEDVRTGLVKDLPKAVSEVAREFQKVLGEPQTYKGRADKALIEEVQKVISVVRGEDVEVQQAKLAEVFLTHFGTKFTTRYGSKGVASIPSAGQVDIKDILSKIGDKSKVKILSASEREKAGLGVALMPKTMGEMAAEMLQKSFPKGTEELQKQLKMSGNKFIIDMFKDVSLGVVPEGGEILEQQDLFKAFTNKFTNLFEGASTDIDKMDRLREAYKKNVGEKIFKEVPIDIRISAHGAAKRGLQTEVLEMAMANIAGSGVGAQTTIKTELGQEGYEYLLGAAGQKGAMSKYTSGLGFKGSGKGKASIEEDITKRMTSQIDPRLDPESKEYKDALSNIQDYASKAADLESTFNMYVDVIDELGEKRRSLIGEKFVQIIEQPHITKAWTKREIELGKKGEKLNIPAFAAYATIFGKESKFLDEIKNTTAEDTKEHWEYIKALQIALGDNTELRDRYLENTVKTINIEQMKRFTDHTGKYAPEGEARSFAGTVFDTERFPTEFALDIPKTKGQVAGQKMKTEKFLMPGALARGTYPEPLIAGEFGPKPIARRLQQVVNTALEASKTISDPLASVGGEMGNIKKNILYSIKSRISEVNKMKGSKALPEKEALFTELSSLLSTTEEVGEGVSGRFGKGLSEIDFINKFFEERTTGDKSKRLSTTINKISDILIGPKDAVEGFISKLDKAASSTEGLIGFAKQAGVDVKQQIIDKKLAALERAKIAYYQELSETVLGKSGSIAKTFFTRRVPSVMAKAITATVDKTKELQDFSDKLSAISGKKEYADLGLGSLANVAEQVQNIRAVHKENVDRYTKIGLPVLKQHEIGIPKTQAKKVPIKFTKKFAVDKDNKIFKAVEEKIDGTLYDLLSYRDELESMMQAQKHEYKTSFKGMSGEAARSSKAEQGRHVDISKYIEEELVPYIESVRYPFTGVSSVQPFKPKLTTGAKMQNVLAVPGMPEMDLEEFGSEIEKVRKVREDVFQKREAAWEGGAGQEEISRLTGLIQELDKAISDVIPKYISHQQKLDYDGDTIQIHSAIMADARQDIKKHFETLFHSTDQLKDSAVETASVFRDQFTYEARQPSTGPYILAEMMKSFGKKFPEDKGFEFLKTPFFTKELEYLAPEKQAEVLGGVTGAGAQSAIENAIKESIREESEQNKALEEVRKAAMDSNSTAKSMLDAITGKETKAFVIDGIKTELVAKKYADAIEAQLFKIHTGPDVEAINRLRRMSESVIGFGGGMIGGEYNPTGGFAERWPGGLEAFGTAGPSGEFHTMLNELERFAIQKGMDVKHAGEMPVAGEMVRLLTQKGGTKRLLSDIQEKEDYGEFKEFGKANEDAIKNRLGKMGTEMIRGELSAISGVRGKDIKGIEAMDRPALVKEVIDLIGLKGFLEELQMQIKEEATKGAKKYYESLEGYPKQKIAKEGLSSDAWAEKEITSQFDEGGIDINKYITGTNQSLYKFRTYSAQPSTFQAKQAKEKGRFSSFGKGRDVFDPSQFQFDPTVAEGTRQGQIKSLKSQYLQAKATAVSIEETMRGLRSESAGGAYGQLMQSTLDNINKEQDIIDDVLSNKVDLKAGIAETSGLDKEGILGIQKRVEEYSKIAGVPRMVKQEKFDIQSEHLPMAAAVAKDALKDEGLSPEELEEQVNLYVEGFIKKVIALKQIDKILETLKARRPERMFFAAMFPKTAVKLPPAGAAGGAAASDVRQKRSASATYPGPPGGAGELPPSMRVSDDVVKVFVVGVAQGVGLVLGASPAAGAKVSSVSSADDFNRAVSDLDAEAVRRVADDIERLNDANARTKDYEGAMWQSVTPPGGRATADMGSRGTKIPGMSGYGDVEDMVKGGAYESYTKPQDIVTGSTISAVFENLKMLHAQAVAYQQTNKLISILSISNKEARDEIEGLVEEAAVGGPDYKVFIEATSRMRDIEGTLTGADVFKAWKLYRIAVGDFLLNRAGDAKRQLDEAEASGDEPAATRSYGEFESNIVNLQKYIKRTVGKPTDIYTERKSYLDPELAKAAGVFLSKGEIIGKATAPLGEDEDLINIFNKLTSDLKQGSTLKSPTAKIRDAFKDLSKQNDDMVDLLLNAEQLKRVGPEVAAAWDFGNVVKNVSRLRAALEQLVRFKPEEMMTAEYEENLRTMVKYLKSVESAYVPFDTDNMPKEQTWGQMGTKRVPKYLAPETQSAMHSANTKKVQEYFKTIETAGGPKIGERYSYVMKIFGDMGDVISNSVVDFHKYGEALNAVGDKVSLFKEKTKDIFSEKESRKSFRAAMGRALRWGAAAKVVYGGAQALGNMVDMLGDVEMAMSQLRMVMSPLESDFPKLQNAAVSFAKEYGIAITDVLKGMKIFAQQGLGQAEVIDRTKTATLAANVTTLNAFEATEALTAAMKIYAQEGENSIRFLDAWSEVEARHAITAGDLANALKKSASAAKNAGVDFDELNGIVAAIGSTTRQSGKEVGTSLRFIFRRLSSDKGPKELAKLGISTLEAQGGRQGLKGGFKVLDELAGKWDTLTSAQKLNIAQSIGGTRQYNSLLVLMDNWAEALSTIQDSMNSKGSAERRNLEVMKTYQKQLEQTKQAANELKLEFGKAYLPIAKFGLKGMRGLLETMTALPGYLKAGAVGLTLFFTYMAKGEKVIDSLVSRVRQLFSWFSEGQEQFGTGLKVGLFESFGIGNEFDPALKNLNRVGQEGGRTLADLHSSLGKTTLLLTRFGKGYNKFVGDIVATSGKAVSSVGKPLKETGQNWSFIAEAASGVGGWKVAKKGLEKVVNAKGLGKDAVGKLLADKSAKSFLKLGGRIAGLSAAIAVEVAALSAAGVGKAMETIGDSVGGMGGKFVKSFAGADTGVLKSLAPLVLTIAALIPTFKVVGKHLSKNIRSAQDYEKAMYGIKRAQESELQTVKTLGNNYDLLEKRIHKANQARDPKVKARKQELGTYKSPLLENADIQKEVINLSNNLADANTRLAVGYDKFGNAILNTTSNLKQYITELEKINVKQLAKTDIDVLSKYVTDLTELEGPEKWKSALKTFVGEVPVVGDLLAKEIKLSPAKVLDDMTTKLNKFVAGKAKAPLTTAFDKDIKALQSNLKTARDGFSKTYSDFRRVLSNITTEGLGSNEIAKMLGADELRKGFELMVEVEPRFNLRETKGKVKWEDVLGAEVMRRTFAKEISSMYDATSVLTKARLETAGVKPREGKAASGDIVTFTDDVSKRYNVAGQQAKLSLKETTDGLFEWVVNYFNTKTLRIEERPFDKDMMGLVDQIFPVRAIEEDMLERVDQLNSFVAGASAGLVGISAKDFKRDFSLGERFFSDIPTTTLIQGTKGFTPTTGGFGESPFQANWKTDFDKYFADPMTEYRTKLEQVEKLRLEGLQGEDTSVSFATGLFEELTRLQEVLKNNQVVLQYRAVFADLTKTMESGTRVIKENIAVEKTRQELQKTTVGLMKGFTEGLDNIDTGITSFADLTVKQRALRGPSDYAQTAGRFRDTEIKRTGLEEQIYSIDKAIVALKSIGDASKGFGAALTPEEMKKYVDTITRVQDESTRELVFETSKVVDNTADTVDRLDELLQQQGDLGALERIIKVYSKPADTSQASLYKLVDTMERTARNRDKFEDAGDTGNVIASNKALDVLTKSLVQAVGLKKAMSLVDANFTIFSKSFQREELFQRAFGGMDLNTFLDKMSEKLPGRDLKTFIEKAPKKRTPREIYDFERTNQARPGFSQTAQVKDLLKLQKEDGTRAKLDSKTLISLGADVAVWKQFDKGYSNRVIDSLKMQTKEVREQAAPLKIKAIKGEVLTTKEQKELTKLDTKLKGLYTAISKEEKVLRRHNFIQWAAGLSAGSAELAKMFGLTESQVKKLGAGTLALYTAFKALEMSGDDVPESFKKFDSALKKGLSKQAMGFSFGLKNMYDLSKSGKEMAKEFKNTSKKKFTRTPEEEVKLKQAVLGEEQRKATKDELSRGGKDIDRLKQILAVVITDTLTGIALKAQEDRTRLSTLTGRAEEQSEAIFNIVVEPDMSAMEKYLYPSQDTETFAAAQKILDEMYAAKIEPGGERNIVPTVTEEVSAVIDSEKERMKVEKDMARVRAILISQYEKEREAASKLQEQLLSIEMYETFRKNIEESLRNAAGRFEDFISNITLGGPAVLNPALSGFPGESELPMLFREMSVQQQAFIRARGKDDDASKASGAYKDFGDFRDEEASFGFFEKKLMAVIAGGFDEPKEKLKAYSFGLAQLPEMINALSALQQRRRELTPIDGEDMTDAAQQEYDTLTRQIDDSTKSIKKLNGVLREMGSSVRLINDLSKAMSDLNTSVQALTLKEQMEDFFKATDKNLSNLIGGSGVNATQMVTLEEQRQARLSGINLKPFDTSRNKEMAELANQLRKSTGGKERSDIIRRMQNLDKEYARKQEAVDRTQSVNRVRGQVDLLKPIAALLTEALRGPEFNTKRTTLGSEGLYQFLNPFESASRSNRRDEISSTRDFIKDITEAAHEITTVGEKLKELKKHKSEFTSGQYEEAYERIKPNEDMDESQKQFRGITPWDQLKLQEKLEQNFNAVSETTASYNMEDMQSVVNNPLHKELHKQTRLLENIDTNTGGEKHETDKVSVEGLHSKPESFISVLKSIFSYMPIPMAAPLRGQNELFKATGGRIFGEGGPREDKVPAYLSPGEFVINTASAQRIGYGALSHMNKKGNIPSFADGGFFGGLSELLGRSGDHLTNERLGISKALVSKKDVGILDWLISSGKMGAIAVPEIGIKYVDLLSKMFIPGESSSGVLTDPEALREDFLKGGTNITAALLVAVRKAKLLKKLTKYLLNPKTFTPGNVLSDVLGKGTDIVSAGSKVARGGSKVAKVGSKVFKGLLDASPLALFSGLNPRGFADGGLVPRFQNGGFFGGISNYLREAGSGLTEARLHENKLFWDRKDPKLFDKEHLKTSVSMGALAVPEIALNTLGGVADFFASVEGISGSQARGTLGKDVLNTIEGVKEVGIGGMLSSAWTSAKDDLAKGGTGITAGILGSIITPAGIQKLRTVKELGVVGKTTLKTVDMSQKVRKAVTDPVVKPVKKAMTAAAGVPRYLNETQKKLRGFETKESFSRFGDLGPLEIDRGRMKKYPVPEDMKARMDDLEYLKDKIDFSDLNMKKRGVRKRVKEVLDVLERINEDFPGAFDRIKTISTAKFDDTSLGIGGLNSYIPGGDSSILLNRDIFTKSPLRKSIADLGRRVMGQPTVADIYPSNVTNKNIHKHITAHEVGHTIESEAYSLPRRHELTGDPYIDSKNSPMTQEFIDLSTSFESHKQKLVKSGLKGSEYASISDIRSGKRVGKREGFAEVIGSNYAGGKPISIKSDFDEFREIRSKQNTYIEEARTRVAAEKAMDLDAEVKAKAEMQADLEERNRRLNSLTFKKEANPEEIIRGDSKLDLAYGGIVPGFADGGDLSLKEVLAFHINLWKKNRAKLKQEEEESDKPSFMSQSFGKMFGRVETGVSDKESKIPVKKESDKYKKIFRDYSDLEPETRKLMGFSDGGLATEEGYIKAFSYLVSDDEDAEEPNLKNTQAIIKSISKHLLNTDKAKDDFYVQRMAEEFGKGTDLAGAYNMMYDYRDEYIPSDQQDKYDIDGVLSLLPRPRKKKAEAKEESWGQKLLKKYTKSVEKSGSSGVKGLSGTRRKDEMDEILERATGGMIQFFNAGGIAKNIDYRQIVPAEFTPEQLANMSYEDIKEYLRLQKEGLLPKGDELNWDAASSYLSQQYIHWQSKGDEAKMKEVMAKIQDLNKFRAAAGQGELGATTLPDKEAIDKYIKQRGVRSAISGQMSTFTKETYDRMGQTLGPRGKKRLPKTWLDEHDWINIGSVKTQSTSASKSYEEAILKNQKPTSADLTGVRALFGDVTGVKALFEGVGEEKQLPSMKLAGINKIGNIDHSDKDVVDKLSPDVQKLIEYNSTLKDFDATKARDYYKGKFEGEELKKVLSNFNTRFSSFDKLTSEMVSKVESGKALGGQSSLNKKLDRLSALHEYFTSVATQTGAGKKESKVKELESLLGGKDMSWRGFMASTQGYAPGEKAKGEILKAFNSGDTKKVKSIYKAFIEEHGDEIDYRMISSKEAMDKIKNKKPDSEKDFFDKIKSLFEFSEPKKDEHVVKQFNMDNAGHSKDRAKSNESAEDIRRATAEKLFGQEQMMHTGGEVQRTGSVFLQKGEHVIPGYASGGLIEALGEKMPQVVSGSNQTLTVEIDKKFEEVVNKLETILANPTSIPVDTTGIPEYIPVNADEAATKLQDAVKNISVDIDINKDVSVGADADVAIKGIAALVEGLESKLSTKVYNIEKEVKEDLEIVKTDSINGKYETERLVDQKIAALRLDVDDYSTKSRLANLEQVAGQQHADKARISDLEYKVQRIQNDQIRLN